MSTDKYKTHSRAICYVMSIVTTTAITSFLSSLRLQKNLWVISTSRKRAPIEPTPPQKPSTPPSIATSSWTGQTTFSSSAGSLALFSSVEVVVVVEGVLCLLLSLAYLASPLSLLVSPLSLVKTNLVSPLSLVETHLAVES